MVVERDYLSIVTGALEQPGVGLVSCLYTGRGDAAWSRIGAAMISFQQTPNMVFAVTHGLAQPCMGSTIALRRDTLTAIGGFERFADVLADDHAMGAAVQALGLSIAVPMLLDHAGDEPAWSALAPFPALGGDDPRSQSGGMPGRSSPCLCRSPCWPCRLLPASPPCGAWPQGGGRAGHAPAARERRPLWCMIAGDVLGFGIFCQSVRSDD
jgi:ceramide glucosyltransferase